jgi:hypothetical protein
VFRAHRLRVMRPFFILKHGPNGTRMPVGAVGNAFCSARFPRSLWARTVRPQLRRGTAEAWMALQAAYDLAQVRLKSEHLINVTRYIGAGFSSDRGQRKKRRRCHDRFLTPRGQAHHRLSVPNARSQYRQTRPRILCLTLPGNLALRKGTESAAAANAVTEVFRALSPVSVMLLPRALSPLSFLLLPRALSRVSVLLPPKDWETIDKLPIET